MNRLPVVAEVRDFLRANATELEDGRWIVPPGPPLFEPAALKLAEVCLITGHPLSQIMTTDLLLSLARRLTVLEVQVVQLRGAHGEAQ